MGVGEEAFHGRTDQDVAGRLIPTVVGATLAVLASVVVTEPEGLRRDHEAVVEGLGVPILVAQLLVPDPQEPASPEQSRTRVGEGEEGKIRIVLEQACGDLGDPRKVGLKAPGLDRRGVAEGLVPQALTEFFTGIRHFLTSATFFQPNISSALLSGFLVFF